MSGPPARRVFTLRDTNRLGIAEGLPLDEVPFDVRSRHLRGSGSATRAAASGPRGAGGRAREGRIVEASQDPRELPRLSPERLVDYFGHHGRIVSG